MKFLKRYLDSNEWIEHNRESVVKDLGRMWKNPNDILDQYTTGCCGQVECSFWSDVAEYRVLTETERDEAGVRPFMTPAVVQRRLDDGEDQLDLSIEKWEILVERWSAGESVKDDVDGDAVGWRSCAMCVTNDSCDRCPYRVHYGHGCDGLGYGHFLETLEEYKAGGDRDTVVRAARGMLDELRQIKAAREENQ